jgi:hypothetical protein
MPLRGYNTDEVPMRKAALLFALTFSLSAFAADVAGKWNAIAKDPSGNEIKAELILKVEGGKLAGSMGSPEGSTPLEAVEFKDNVLTYKLDYAGTPVSVKMKLDGDKLKGEYTTDGGDSGPIEAERAVEKAAAPAAASPIAGDWKVTTTGPDGSPIKLVMTLKQADGKWEGQIVIEEYGMTVPLTDIKVDGTSLTCNIPTDNGTYALEAKVADEKLDGTSTGPDGTKNKMSGTR